MRTLIRLVLCVGCLVVSMNHHADLLRCGNNIAGFMSAFSDLANNLADGSTDGDYTEHQVVSITQELLDADPDALVLRITAATAAIEAGTVTPQDALLECESIHDVLRRTNKRIAYILFGLDPDDAVE